MVESLATTPIFPGLLDEHPVPLLVSTCGEVKGFLGSLADSRSAPFILKAWRNTTAPVAILTQPLLP